jgi:hypothetical protein
VHIRHISYPIFKVKGFFHHNQEKIKEEIKSVDVENIVPVTAKLQRNFPHENGPY